MVFIWLFLYGIGQNVLQLASEFLIHIQLGVAWRLVLKMKKALCAEQDENLYNGLIKDLSPDNRGSSTGCAMFYGCQYRMTRQDLHMELSEKANQYIEYFYLKQSHQI